MLKLRVHDGVGFILPTLVSYTKESRGKTGRVVKTATFRTCGSRKNDEHDLVHTFAIKMRGAIDAYLEACQVRHAKTMSLQNEHLLLLNEKTTSNTGVLGVHYHGRRNSGELPVRVGDRFQQTIAVNYPPGTPEFLVYLQKATKIRDEVIADRERLLASFRNGENPWTWDVELL